MLTPLLPGSGFMTSTYNLQVVAASFGIAWLAAYAALDVARRIQRASWRIALVWWSVGSVVMGTGFWATHFLGLQSLQLPVTLGFSEFTTLLSWLLAVCVSGVVLGLAGLPHARALHWLASALVLGAGMGAMHYLGMQALEMSIPIVWNPWLVAASLAMALLAALCGLGMFRLLLAQRGPRRLLHQVVASAVSGLAMGSMHYMGMAAAQFPEGAVCLSVDGLTGSGLTAVIILATTMLLVSTLVASVLDALLQHKARQLTRSLKDSNAKLQSANAALHKQAFADPLTGLPNRLLLEDRLHHALLRLERANAGGAQQRLGVLFVDLDGFKPINDSLGHTAGDAILQSAAQRLREEARDSDTVARMGGDEFLVLLEDVGRTADCLGVVQRLLDTLSQPFDLAGRQVQISCSIGVVVYPDQGEREKLVANADAAMYAAKRAGGNGFALFEDHMNSDASEQLELQKDLRQALQRGELALHYQPKIDGQRGHICGVEALLRWNHPTRGAISPAVFIALAERFGLINTLGSWVIDEACRQIAEWARSGLRIRVAINVSVHQLREAGLAQRITRSLQAHGVDAGQLLCEITETVAMEDTRTTQRTLRELARIGVFLSIDDFGTGHSSLSYLRRLPAQQLKIDSSFVQDLEHQEDARAVVDAVVRLAHALGLKVVAEGVETSGQRDILLGMRCDELQGFFFARPMPADRLQAWALDDQPEGTLGFSPSVFGIGDTLEAPGAVPV